MDNLDRDKPGKSKFLLSRSYVKQGEIIAEVKETESVNHKSWCLDIEGEITEAVCDGLYNIDQVIGKVRMATRYIVSPLSRNGCPELDRIVTGFLWIYPYNGQVIDTLFPMSKGGAAAIRRIRAGKHLLNTSFAKWANADIIIMLAAESGE